MAAGFESNGIQVTRKQPGHFVALTEDGRIDARLAKGGVKVPDALEKRAAIDVNDAKQGPSDGSALAPAPGVKSVDPYDIAIVMPAADGEPVVSDGDMDVWSKFRIVYDVTFEATPFKVSGVLLLLPSVDVDSLIERGTQLFLPVFAPVVQAGATTIKDCPRDAILVNRSHMRKLNARKRN